MNMLFKYRKHLCIYMCTTIFCYNKCATTNHCPFFALVLQSSFLIRRTSCTLNIVTYVYIFLFCYILKGKLDRNQGLMARWIKGRKESKDAIFKQT